MRQLRDIGFGLIYNLRRSSLLARESKYYLRFKTQERKLSGGSRGEIVTNKQLLASFR